MLWLKKIFERLKRQRDLLINLALFAAGAVFLDLPFERIDYFWPFGIFGIFLFFVLLERLRGRKKAFAVGWLFGFFFFLISFRWLLDVFPNETMGLYQDLSGVLIILIVWFYLSIVMGFLFGVFALFFKRFFCKKRVVFLSLILIPSLWAFGEYFRAWLFSIATWGPDALVGPFWTFGNIGYTLAGTPFFYLSRVGGLYGLSFFSAFTALVIFFLWRSKRYFFLAFFLAVFLLSGWLPSRFSEKFGSLFGSGERKSVRVMLLGIPQKAGFFYKEGFIELLEEDGINQENQPEIVVFPEGFTFLSLVGDIERPILEKIFPDQERDGFIIANRIIISKNKKLSQLIYRDKEGKLLGVQSKSFLVPGGEFLPFFIKEVVGALNRSSISTFLEIRSQARAEEAISPFNLGRYRVGVFLCSGVVSPVFSKILKRRGAQLIINVASYSVWKSSGRLNKELELMARFIAMSNNLYYLQSTNFGPALIIDNNGNIISKSSDEKAQVLNQEIYLIN